MHAVRLRRLTDPKKLDTLESEFSDKIRFEETEVFVRVNCWVDWIRSSN
jgi:hypothetical protein